MITLSRNWRWRRPLLAGVVLVAACSSPTEPKKGVEAPAPDTGPGSAPGRAVLRSFGATPDKIVEGDQFALAWEGENGAVSLARKDAPPFAVGLPSSGTSVLKRGTSGYPAGTGAVVYVATIGDSASRLEATLTVLSTCGRNGCEADKGENCSTCPEDCGCPSHQRCDDDGMCRAYCGNGVCEAGERCSTCLRDCPCASTERCESGGVCRAFCGNGLCDNGERCQSCADCLSSCDACLSGLSCSGVSSDYCNNRCGCTCFNGGGEVSVCGSCP